MNTLRVFFLLFAAALPLCAQEANSGSIPDAILRPQRGEEARYPQDTVIGELGPGEAPADAYRAARNVLNAFLRNNRESSLLAAAGPIALGEIFSGIGAVNPEKFRIGGGRIMPDGSASFLFRFLGREKGVSGELYLRREASAEDAPPGPWRFDDALLDEIHDTQVRREVYRFDFTPYERFY
ncbi:MAG: hypothetical protein LBQ35_00715 [Spirochaetaceae bacterium]|jgi:hypothetical protein|nr:hypothetical protein [Spirochaetaceae bacterium]